MSIMHKAFAALGIGLACGVAQAGNISWSIGINLPPVGTVISNAPVYADGPYYGAVPYRAAPPVVYRPAPIYYSPPPVVYRPAPIYYVSPPAVVYAPRYDGHRGWGHRDRHWQRVDRDDRHHRRDHRRNRDRD